MADISVARTIPVPEHLRSEYQYEYTYQTDVRNHGDGIVYKRNLYEWILPASLASHLNNKCNPKHLPVICTQVVIQEASVEIWELCDVLEYDRRVYALGKSNEDHYQRLAVARIDDGYLGSPALPAISFV
jgi:hypothetical protein